MGRETPLDLIVIIRGEQTENVNVKYIMNEKCTKKISLGSSWIVNTKIKTVDFMKEGISEFRSCRYDFLEGKFNGKEC